MRDSTEFKRWQARERKKDEINRIIHIHKKKVEMELAREAGIQAYENKHKENRKNAVALKKKNKNLLEKRRLKNQKDQNKKYKLMT